VNPEGFVNAHASMPTLPTKLRCSTTHRNGGRAEACGGQADHLLETTREQAAYAAAGLWVRMANIRADAKAPATVQT
jgi:hypothetical protein